MTVLRFDGELELGDEFRVGYLEDGAIRIGDRDVIDEVYHTQWNRPVTVAFADQRFSGDLTVDLGWGYSEYTPMDPDELAVGEHNIIPLLKEHEGEEVTLWVADEPINTLEGSNT